MSSDECAVQLRPVAAGDCEMVFRWRNDPAIVDRGSSHRKVGGGEHRKWFAETLLERERKMFIVLNQGNPVGQVRFDRTSKHDCVISVYLQQEFTGRGLGVQAIGMGCAEIFRAWDVERTMACVRHDNPEARSAFLKAGFTEVEARDVCPEGHYSLVLRRSRQ